jgi:predicted dehydrogenase
MGPYYVAMLVQLLGPVTKVTAAGTIGLPERTITAPNSPRLGATITVETLTTVQGVLEFACGAQVAFSYSWDVHQHGGRHLELYVELGSLRMPDPNYFGGVIETSLGNEPWQTIDTGVHDLGRVNYPADAPVGANFRGIGLQDLAKAIRDGRRPRASGEMGYHVLDVLTAIGEAAAQERAVAVTSGLQRPEPMPLDGLAGTSLVARGA